MINLLGTIVNAAAIIVGALLGKILGRGLPENIKNTVLQGLGLGVPLLEQQWPWRQMKLW